MKKNQLSTKHFFLKIAQTLIDSFAHKAEDGKELPTIKNIVKTASSIQSATQTNSRSDCKKGCHYCCFGPVSVSAFETIIIVEYLQTNFSNQELSEIMDKLQGSIERKFVGQPCPMLGSKGQCTIYEVRPILCQGLMSCSAIKCSELFSEQDLPQEIPFDEKSFMTSRALLYGLQSIADKLGLANSTYLLTDAIWIALTTPDVTKKWLEGEDVFVTCMTTD